MHHDSFCCGQFGSSDKAEQKLLEFHKYYFVDSLTYYAQLWRHCHFYK